MAGCSITDDYAFRGTDVVFMENDHLHVEVLAGKGGDVTEIRDKRTDVNVLFESPAEWHVPTESYRGLSDGVFDFMDYYPGGWQDVLPGAGGPAEAGGAPFALHGESAVVPWEATVTEDASDRVAVTLSLSLTRYPFEVERTLLLSRGESRLVVEETVTNTGERDLDYSWLQHLAFGRPLLGPEARVEAPCETVVTDPGQGENARLPADEEYEWPVCDPADGAPVDLSKIPPKESGIAELVALTDFSEGRYTISNPDLDLATTVTFPTDLFEYVWYWGSFGGFEEAPFFGRNYNLGLEPCTSIPNAGLEEQVARGTAATLPAGETVEATLAVETSTATD
jgi:galactose mutarotase-like enzyme